MNTVISLQMESRKKSSYVQQNGNDDGGGGACLVPSIAACGPVPFPLESLCLH